MDVRYIEVQECIDILTKTIEKTISVNKLKMDIHITTLTSKCYSCNESDIMSRCSFKEINFRKKNGSQIRGLTLRRLKSRTSFRKCETPHTHTPFSAKMTSLTIGIVS